MYSPIIVVAYALLQANSPCETTMIERIQDEIHQSSPYKSIIQQELQPTKRYNEIKISLEAELRRS